MQFLSQKILVPLLLLAALLVAGSVFSLLAKHMQTAVPAVSTNPTAVGEVSYTTEHLFAKDEGGGVAYIKITSGAPQPILDTINADIYAQVVTQSCFGDPRDPKNVDELRQQYMYHFEAFNGKGEGGKALPSETEAKKWSYETLRKHLVDDFGYNTTASTSILYAQQGLLSMSVGYESDCAGAHPGSGEFGLNYDLITGEKIELKTMVSNFAAQSSELASIIFSFASKINPPSADKDNSCNYMADWHAGVIDPEYTQYAFTTQGLKILSFEYPHAAANCEPTGVVVPWSLLKKFLIPKYQQIFLK